MAKITETKKTKNGTGAEYLRQFSADFSPFEPIESLFILTDSKTGAQYCECHVKGSALIRLGTLDVPLDPDEQPEYRANRELRKDHPAFVRMQEDAKLGRSFSNIVVEYSKTIGKRSHPLKIIGGQHRFEAIKIGLSAGQDQYHGVKVYFGLDLQQRLV